MCSGKFLPADAARRAIAMQWFMQACSDVAGTSGAIFALENVAPEKVPANADFFKARLTNFFRNADARLAGREYLADELSVADFALYPVVAQRNALAGGLANLNAWRERMAARPGVSKGMNLSGG